MSLPCSIFANNNINSRRKFNLLFFKNCIILKFYFFLFSCCNTSVSKKQQDIFSDTQCSIPCYFLFYLIFFLLSTNHQSFLRIPHTGSPNVSGCPGSKISLQVMTVTRFSVSLRLMILCVHPGIICTASILSPEISNSTVSPVLIFLS